MHEQTWSITRKMFKKHFLKMFKPTAIQTKPCRVSVNFIGNPEDQVQLILSNIPSVPDTDLTKTLTVKMETATSDFLKAIQKSATETDIDRYSTEAQSRFAESKLDDTYLEGLVESQLSRSTSRQKMVAFIRDKVLGGNLRDIPDITGITSKFTDLTEDNFKRLSFDKKLTTLTWLYRQLNTIAQLVSNPYQSVSTSGDTTSIRFYRPFAIGVHNKIKNKSESAENFRIAASDFLVETLGIASRITQSGVPTEAFNLLKESLTAFVKKENQRNKELSATWRKKFKVNGVTPKQRHEQSIAMEYFIQKEVPPPGNLPLNIISLFDVLTNDPTWIGSPPRFSTAQTESLRADVKKRGSSNETIVLQQETQTSAIRQILNDACELRQSQKTAQQINLGLLYCLSRITLLSLYKFPEASALKDLRTCLGHFSYKLELSETQTSTQLYNLACLLVQTFEKAEGTIDENPFSAIEENPLYKKLIHIKAQVKPENDLQSIETTITNLWNIRNESRDEQLTIRGWMIVCGQAGRDLSGHHSNVDAKVIQFLKKHCATFRNLAMHETLIISIQEINHVLNKVAHLNSPLKTSQPAPRSQRS